MWWRRAFLRAILSYSICSVVLAVALAECAFHPARVPISKVSIAQAAGRVPFCAIVAESPFASFRQIAFVRVGQFCGAGNWLGRTLLRPAVELAFLYGRLAHGVWLSDVSPETSVAAVRVPVLLIHGLADANIPVQQSEMIFAQNPAAIRFWKVPNAGHCGARNAAAHEFDERVVGWFASHRFKSH